MFYTLFCFSSFFTQFAFYPHLRNPLPESAFYPHLRNPRFILKCGIRFRNPRFILICGIRLRNPLPQSASAIRIPVPRFIPTLGQINVLSVALPQKAGHLKVYVFIVGYTFFIVHTCTIGLNSVFRGPKLDLRQYNIAIYRVYQKKLNRFEIALNFAKHLFVSGFLYI